MARKSRFNIEHCPTRATTEQNVNVTPCLLAGNHGRGSRGGTHYFGTNEEHSLNLSRISAETYNQTMLGNSTPPYLTPTNGLCQLRRRDFAMEEQKWKQPGLLRLVYQAL